MTDTILEQIEQLVADYHALKEFEKIALEERNILGKYLDTVRHNIYSCQCERKNIVISNLEDAEALVMIATTMRALKEEENELQEEYQKANNKYSTAWPKSVKIRKKIHKFQDQYWRDMDLFILPFA